MYAQNGYAYRMNSLQTNFIDLNQLDVEKWR